MLVRVRPGAARRGAWPSGPATSPPTAPPTATLDPTDLVDLYWAGRATLVSRRDDIAVFDEVFREYFLGERNPVEELLRLTAQRVRRGRVGAGGAPADRARAERGRRAGHHGARRLGRRRAAAQARSPPARPTSCARVRRIMARIRLDPPRRRTRRNRPSRRGRRPDLRRTVRDALRLHGEPVPPALAAAPREAAPAGAGPRRVRLDGRLLPRAAAVRAGSAPAGRRGRWRCSASAPGSPASRPRCGSAAPDRALAEAAELVVDWEGGTRIGDVARPSSSAPRAVAASAAAAWW